jgi:hypothetical protein
MPKMEHGRGEGEVYRRCVTVGTKNLGFPVEFERTFSSLFNFASYTTICGTRRDESALAL